MKKLKQAEAAKRNFIIWLAILAVVIGIAGYYFLTLSGSKEITDNSATAMAVADKEFQLTKFPFVKTYNLDFGRYEVSFQSDQLVRFTVYNEARYNEWLSTGTHTLSKISTQHGSKCCTPGGSYTVDINEGEAGTYYFVFEDAKNLGASSGKIVINKIGELGR